MASRSTQDPRLKRPASASPDTSTPRDPKRPATMAYREMSPTVAANNTMAARSNGVVSIAAPVADMTRKSQNAPIVDLKTQINLQSIATITLQLKYDTAEAQLKTVEADYQSHAAKGHLNIFPAMKETKTAALDRAKRAFQASQQPLESARKELHRLTKSLVDLEQSVKAPVQDAISRAEFEELKRDVQSVKSDIGSVRKDLSGARETINACKADQAIATKTMEGLRRTVDSQPTRMDVAPPAIPASVDPNILERLDTVEADLKDMESQIDNTDVKVASFVIDQLQAPKDALVELKTGLQNTDNAVAELQKGLKESNDETVHIREILIKAVDDQHTNAKTLEGCLKQLHTMEPLLGQTADKDALTAVQTSLQQLSNVVDSIRTAQEKTAQDLATQEKASQERAAQEKAAQERTSNGESRQRLTNGVTSGLSSFQPISGGDDEDDVSPFQSRPVVPGTLRRFDDKDLCQMKAEIEALKYQVQDQKNRYNNLLTDHLAQNVLDNLGTVYPNLKEAERVTKTVQEIQGKMRVLDEVSMKTGTIASRVDTLDSKAAAFHNSAGKDVTRLKNDLTVLSGRVDQHARDIETGRAQFQEHTAAIQEHTLAIEKHSTTIEKAEADVRAVQTWISNKEDV